jgi:hypothetical protein
MLPALDFSGCIAAAAAAKSNCFCNRKRVGEVLADRWLGGG